MSRSGDERRIVPRRAIRRGLHLPRSRLERLGSAALEAILDRSSVLLKDPDLEPKSIKRNYSVEAGRHSGTAETQANRVAGCGSRPREWCLIRSPRDLGLDFMR